eukprot:COSAG01_NODE_1564_length_9896_cov_4.868837_13_plen_59_part_00
MRHWLYVQAYLAGSFAVVLLQTVVMLVREASLNCASIISQWLMQQSCRARAGTVHVAV